MGNWWNVLIALLRSTENKTARWGDAEQSPADLVALWPLLWIQHNKLHDVMLQRISAIIQGKTKQKSSAHICTIPTVLTRYTTQPHE